MYNLPLDARLLPIIDTSRTQQFAQLCATTGDLVVNVRNPCIFVAVVVIRSLLLQMYSAQLNVDAALYELFAYARQYQYEVTCFS